MSEKPSVRIEVESSSEVSSIPASPSGDGPPNAPTTPRVERRWTFIAAAIALSILGLALWARPDAGNTAADVDRALPGSPTTTLVEVPTEPIAQDMPDPSSIIRTPDGFFALGDPGESLNVWRSPDGTTWEPVEIELNGSTSDFGLFSGLRYSNGELSMVRLAGGGQIVHRLTSPDGVEWTRAERLELEGGGFVLPLAQTSSAIAILGEMARGEPIDPFLEQLLANPQVLAGVEMCGAQPAGPLAMSVFPCSEGANPVRIFETDLKPGVSMGEASACVSAIENSGPFAERVLVTSRDASQQVSFDESPVIAGAVLERLDSFALLVDGTRDERLTSVIEQDRTRCDGLIELPPLPDSHRPAIVVFDSDDLEQRRFELPDGAEFAVSPAQGLQVIAESPDGDAALVVLLGDYVWHLDLDTGEWNQRFEREPTFTTSGSTYLSPRGEKLVLFGSDMRVGSLTTGEWTTVSLPENSTPVYVDDEIALLRLTSGSLFRVGLPG